MSMRRFFTATVVLTVFLSTLGAAPQAERIVLGGKAIALVADAVFLFPEARDRIAAVAQADQGLGTFLAAIDPGFGSKIPIDRAAGPEVYAGLKPDLVIMKSSMRKSSGPGLDALRIPQLYLDLETPEDYLRELRLLGDIFGNPRRAEELVGYYSGMLDMAAARARSLPKAPRVLVLQAQAGTNGGFEVPPSAWIQTIMVERAGGIPVWKDANPGSGWAKVGLEQIAAWNPDHIFIISYRESSSAVAASFKADPRLSGLSAVQKGRVHAFPQDFYSWDQPDTRWALGLLWLGTRLVPEAYRDLSLDAEIRRFFNFAYGLSGSRFDSVIAPKLKGDLGK